MRCPGWGEHVKRVQGVEPSLGWSYLSREALARAKAQMDEESTGVRDEIGFLTIHQSYADRFFPGTSVLHTRALCDHRPVALRRLEGFDRACGHPRAA